MWAGSSALETACCTLHTEYVRCVRLAGVSPGGGQGATMDASTVTTRRHRTPAMHVRWMAVAALLGAAGLSACGSSAGDQPAASTGTTVGPLAELMGWSSDSPEESRRKQLQVEDLVAECMREEGWEYIPVDWSAQSSDQTEDMSLMNDPEAYGKKYGYSVVHNYELWEEPSLSGDGEAQPGGQEVVDPNQDYVSQLSQSENEEYYASLYGRGSMTEGTAVAATDVAVASDDTAVAATVSASPVSPEDQGCSGRASAQVYGSDPMQSNPDLQERMNEFWQDSQNDPRLLTAADQWVECMADVIDGVEVAGGPIEKPDQMYSYVDRMKYELMGLEIVPFVEGDASGGEGGTNYYTAWTDEDGKGEAAVGEPQPIDEADLEELRQTELDLWAKDWACQQEADIAGIRTQIEQELVDQLRADFPELGPGQS